MKFTRLFPKLKIMVLILFIFITFLSDLYAYLPMDDVAKTIATGVGTVREVKKGNKTQIFIFEERHDSIRGQMEIAIMLIRLFKSYGVNLIGLEGYFPEQGSLKVDWINKYSPDDRIEVAAQLLKEGEISAVEYCALAFPEMTVEGVGDSKLYSIEYDDRFGYAILQILYQIAAENIEEDISEKELDEIIAKLYSEDPEAILEGMIDVINLNSFSKSTYNFFMKSDNILTSVEDELKVIQEIKDKIKQLDIEIDTEVKEIIENTQKFFAAASGRSDLMIDNLKKTLKRKNSNKIALIIGAAHTKRINDLLIKEKNSYAIIRPLSLNIKDDVLLGIDAYNRKIVKKSVDENGLGALLDGRKKPVPLIDQVWVKSKANLNYATVALARAAGTGNWPPDKDLLTYINTLPGIHIDEKQPFKIDNGEVIFKADVKTQDGKDVVIWCRAVYVDKKIAELADDLIEQYYDQLIYESKNDSKMSESETGISKDNTNKEIEKKKKINKKIPVIRNSINTLAVFLKDQNEVMKNRILSDI